MAKIVGVKEAHQRLTKLIRAAEGGDQVVITRDGTPSAVLLGAREYTSLMATLEEMADPAALRPFREAQSDATCYTATGRAVDRSERSLCAMTKNGRRRPRVSSGLSIIGVLILIVVTSAVGSPIHDRQQEEIRQNQLERFYTPPSPLPPGLPGELLRTEPVSFAPKGARGWRILYRSEDSRGSATVSSGMVFAPAGPAPAGGRPVVAWAHGTVGMGPQCAPSRSSQPLRDMGWLGGMLANGWVVVATDYAGLGTPGLQHYLVGADEARDVLNSVRAARSLAGAGAGNRFATWGHSQGGHAALFAAQLSRRYAPGLKLVAAAAAAPAGELVPLFSQQSRSPIAWVIGPEVLRAWPSVYTDLAPQEVATPAALRNYRRLADECVLLAAVEGAIRAKLGQNFFARDAMTVPAWRARAEENTPAPLPRAVPVFVAQGLADSIVLPNTTALLAQRWCAARSNLTMLWLKDTNHLQVAKVAGPTVITWLRRRFAGVRPRSTCGTALPIRPATIP